MKSQIRNTFLIVVSTVLTMVGCQEEQSVAKQQPAKVSVAEVINQTITEWDEFTGRLQSPHSVELKPRVSGYIEKVHFSEGSEVKEGDFLIQIDDRSFKAEIAGLEAQLNSAKSQLSLAKSGFERAKKLSASKAISDEVLDNRLAQKQSAEAAVNSVKAALDVVRLNLSHARVVAPISGKVSRAIATKGNFVTAGQTVLTSIVSTNEMYAYFSADESTYLNYAELLKEDQQSGSKGNNALVYMALINDDGYPHKGYIDFIDNQIDPNTGTILGRAVFDNKNSLLLPGMFTRLRLTASKAYDAILIDDKSVGTDLNKKFVLVLDKNNTVQYRPVVLGEKIASLRIVLSGLEAKEKIVVNGLQRVRPGTPVSPELVPMANEKALNILKETQNHTKQVADTTSGNRLNNKTEPMKLDEKGS